VGSSVRIALAVAVVLSLALPAASRGAITVANTNDEGPGSLRQAIEDSGPGETIIVPAGTYTLASELGINKGLTISGHAAANTIIRAGEPNRVLSVSGVGNDVTVSGVTIRDGNGVSEGGGIYNNEANLTLREVVITNNHASADGEPGQFGGIARGGGIRSKGGSLAIVESMVRGNIVSAVGGAGKFGGLPSGGGVESESALRIEGSTITGNTADARGGQGIANAEQFGGNASGGGLSIALDQDAEFSKSTVAHNLADASGGPGGAEGISDGGGILLFEGPGTQTSLTGLTITANEARALGDPKGAERVRGGGIRFEGGAGSGLAVTATTLGANSVVGSESEGGNLFWTGPSSPTFRDTIISGGVGPPGSQNCEAEAVSLGFNLEGRDQCGFGAAGDIVDTDPQLGPLQDNGGPTATMALATTSPAVDRGAAFGLATDQRGLPRPFDFSSAPNSSAAGADGSDIGAFELQPPATTARIHDLILGKLQRNQKKGTATLTVSLPVPDPGALTLSGKGLRSQTAPVSATGIVKLAVVGNGVVKKALRLRHRRRVRISVTYAPATGAAVTRSRTAKLIRKARKPKRH
jgi:hypothetical protein